VALPVLPGSLTLHLVSRCACGSPRSSPAKRPRPGYQGPAVKGSLAEEEL
jgi:hypothetical protein